MGCNRKTNCKKDSTEFWFAFTNLLSITIKLYTSKCVRSTRGFIHRPSRKRKKKKKNIKKNKHEYSTNK